MRELGFKRTKEGKELKKYMENMAEEQIKQSIEEANEQSEDSSIDRETTDDAA